MRAIVYKYRCSMCAATKEIHDRGSPSINPPKDVPCGWRGCNGRAKLIIP